MVGIDRTMVARARVFMMVFWLLEMMESYGYAAMFIAMVAENANIPIPSEIVLGFSGFLISQGIFHFWPTFIIACAAGVTGSILSYWLGSYGGRPLLQKYGKYIFFSIKSIPVSRREETIL